MDGLGNGLGYGAILIIVAFVRELLGSGKIWGYEVLGDPLEKTGLYAYGYLNNGFIILAPMALILVGIVIWVQRSINRKLIEK
jgi:Na+-transporting NADH:ubiquinone oxidoreductase subunit D